MGHLDGKPPHDAQRDSCETPVDEDPRQVVIDLTVDDIRIEVTTKPTARKPRRKSRAWALQLLLKMGVAAGIAALNDTVGGGIVSAIVAGVAVFRENWPYLVRRRRAVRRLQRMRKLNQNQQTR